MDYSVNSINFLKNKKKNNYEYSTEESDNQNQYLGSEDNSSYYFTTTPQIGKHKKNFIRHPQLSSPLISNQLKISGLRVTLVNESKGMTTIHETMQPKHYLYPNKSIDKESYYKPLSSTLKTKKIVKHDNKFTYSINQNSNLYSNLNMSCSKDKELNKTSVLAMTESEHESKYRIRGFKYRFFIERNNGFNSLFRNYIRMDPEFMELSENLPDLCNYIHIQRTSTEFNILKLPKHGDDLMAFYRNKQKVALEYIEQSKDSSLKKIIKYISQDLSSPHQFKYFSCLFSHMECNKEICSKQGLFQNLRQFYLDNKLDLKNSLLPLTFVIDHSRNDKNEWTLFDQYFNSVEEKVWIVKPGEDSNKGNGIKVFRDLDKILEYTKSEAKPWIVQKYIEKPLLIKNRKFDIRLYGLVSTLHGKMKAHLFRHCYVRTNSIEYTLKNLEDSRIHLSNDAIQIKDKENYGKYEEHNKMSIAQFTKQYLLPKTRNPNYFYDVLFPKMRDEFARLMSQVKHKLDPHRRHHSFEILGFDFMLDEQLDLYLLEINNNPALGTQGSKVLENSIMPMRTDVFNLTLNKLYFGFVEKDNKNYDVVYED